MMPLLLAQTGQENIIKKIGGNPETKKHLENLGFVVGGTVTIVNSLGGNLIVNVKESRVAIRGDGRQDHGMTAQAFIHIL